MQNFTLIAGPCVIESADITFQIAHSLRNLSHRLPIKVIFKASYKKANRTSIRGFTGIGDAQAHSILKDVKETFGLPICTDIHESSEVAAVAEVADILQIPAMLCRQTELLLTAGATNKPVLIKKGQFMSAQSMLLAAEKVQSTGNNNIWLCERGNSFGYQDLIVDMRNIPIMQSTGLPVIIDATHANQQPNSSTGVTAGTPQYIATIAKSGIAAGADGVFLEVHPHPSASPSDAATILALDKLPELVEKLLAIYALGK
jgi:2-dehydro-3-deoxyphosphooctonate aldolase (KDO 8-P synthase)